MKSKTLRYLGTIGLCGVCFVGLTSMKAPENVPEQEPIVEVVPEEQEVKEKIQNFFDTYLVPLLSGVSITSVISALVSVTFAVLNRRTNKLIKSSNTETLNLTTSVLKNCLELIDEVKKSNEISKETRDKFVESTLELSTHIASLTGKTEELLKMKEILVTIGEIQAELSKIDPKAITSGVAQSVEKLSEQIKSLG